MDLSTEILHVATLALILSRIRIEGTGQTSRCSGWSATVVPYNKIRVSLADEIVLDVRKPDSAALNQQRCRPGLEVIKLEFILRPKIKLNDWLLAEQPNIVLHFESETILKFYNLEACLHIRSAPL